MQTSPGRLSRRERIESDLRMVRALARVAPDAAKNRASSTSTVADRLEKVVDDHGAAVALIDASDDGRTVTYAELDAQANRIAHWASAHGIGRGDVVALLMANRPEFVSTWLGLAKVGAVTALINTNLTGEPLRHSIRVAGAEHLVVDAELADQWAEARADEMLTEWRWGGPNAPTDFDATLATMSATRPDRSVREGLVNGDPLFFIYTSGTTGLPKAARFSHGKFLTVAGGSAGLIGFGRSDRMYVTLPLYHTAGGVMALGAPLLDGGTAIITRKFSTSRFWDDCVRHGATTFQYIGELCRYLANSPSHPLERAHQLRICIGNGLRPDVWPTFQERFRIPRIVEFYGATEGTSSLFNLDNRVGAIGRLRPALAKRMGIHLVRYDVAADEIERDAEGRVIEVGPGEPGEAITRISSITPFEGYSDEEASEKKILRGAFKDGDTYFRTGDLLSQDEDGYYFFVDRVGDTFRWKGENVSTAEVSAVLGECDGVLEANVYGVEVPGADGRAGMATLVVDDQFSPDAVLTRLTENLPAYARPLFLRVQTEVEITATFKHRKKDAMEEGFDPALPDPIWFLDPETGSYVRLDAERHQRITTGEIRL
ncbi:MAG: long-chain-acyl-CoA synthetase [Acidimicrobiales bacterium]